MNERRDDTTKPEAESRPEGRAPGRYYYDDATGYETYRPDAEDDAGDEEGDGEEGGPPA